MRIKVNGERVEPTEIDTKIAHIDVRFDMDMTEVWWVTAYNAEGDQVGDSVDSALKSDAKDIAKEWAEEEGATLTVAKRDGSY